MKLYVTYAYGSAQRDNFSVVEGEDISACFATISKVCGSKYAFTYTECQKAECIDHYNLVEIPLQAQQPRDDQDNHVFSALAIKTFDAATHQQAEMLRDREEEFRSAQAQAMQDRPAPGDDDYNRTWTLL